MSLPSNITSLRLRDIFVFCISNSPFARAVCPHEGTLYRKSGRCKLVNRDTTWTRSTIFFGYIQQMQLEKNLVIFLVELEKRTLQISRSARITYAGSYLSLL